MLLGLLLVPSCGYTADAARGEVVAKVRCSPCHHLDSPSTHIGPSLLGVYGRKPSIEGVPFQLWSARSLELWLRNPRAVKPNTKMQIPPLSRRDRQDIIAYLAQRASSLR
ncbi:MAG: hypothetical protein D6703_06330 [Zetaproteobacteria bacterium]|nr:MAG: hypothetical protein D6703_06330 [Zetaproteobacteria bacterium]